MWPESKLVLAIEVVGNIEANIPIAGPAIAVLAPIAGAVAAEYETRNNNKYYYLFPSFSEIDRAVYQIAYRITDIYAPFITQLTESEAAQLGGLVGKELKSYMEYQKNLRTKKIVTMEDIVSAVGKYHEIDQPDSERSPLVHGDVWRYGDIFLGSGIEVQVWNGGQYITPNVNGVGNYRFVRQSNDNRIAAGWFIRKTFPFGPYGFTKFPDKQPHLTGANNGYRIFKFHVQTQENEEIVTANIAAANKYMLDNFSHFLTDEQRQTMQGSLPHLIIPRAISLRIPNRTLCKTGQRVLKSR
jgi:hypothetical protein